jgi:hypothetical protein
VQYSKDRTADVYPAYQLGWFPDYSDADNYLTPFFLKKNFLGNHYDNQEVNDLILKQAVETDKDKRMADIEKIQDIVAKDLSTVPLLQGAQVAVRQGREGSRSTRRSSSASRRSRSSAPSDGAPPHSRRCPVLVPGRSTPASRPPHKGSPWPSPPSPQIPRRRARRPPEGTGRYILIRFLLIFPTVLIL